MRILWISHFLPYPPTGHGALQRSFNLIAQTARCNEVHLLSLALPCADKALVDEAVDHLARLAASVTLFRNPNGTLRFLGRILASAMSPLPYWNLRYTSP